PNPDVLYYHFILALIAANGWLIRRMGRVGQSRIELILIFVDLVIMTFGMVVPNPFANNTWPLAAQYHLDNFQYFFLILAGGTLAYSWRTVIAIGSWTAGLWTATWLIAWWVATPFPDLSRNVAQVLAAYPVLIPLSDPTNFVPHLRIQEVLVFVLVAVMLGFSIRRFNRLLMSNASLERERANLSRYFSPNVVDQLSQNDDPLKQVRSQNVAVMFVDIVGFTRFSATRSALDVVDLLREFQSRMETEVFRHNGTLDKYLGDGLMATFGTPVAGQRDASNAFACAQAMLAEMDNWNRDRTRRGEPEIRIGIGIHYGEAVLGDIGVDRLEFAVIGNTVNVAARLETLTRTLGDRLAISDDLKSRMAQENGTSTPILDHLRRHDHQVIRGLENEMTVWSTP
ncbi:MAG: adenylate/guanylate cyclase domain-containing protein, partial [Pseudomonadota bacterium]